MTTLKDRFERMLITIVERLKKMFCCQTWQVETVFILVALASVAALRLIITHHGWVEWLGVLAVHWTARHASVANRLEEKERRRAEMTGGAEVECYKELDRYFLKKEITWCFYFSLVGAYSALVGVAIFLAYPWWRRTWRRYHPV